MRNSLTSVSRNSFAGLQSSLEHLYLSEPFLSELPFDTLDNLHELKTFVLEDTQVTEIPRLYAHSKLEYLKIDGARVQSISSATFKLMTKMKKVHVSRCLIKEIPESALEGLVHLRELNMSFNAIEWIHPRAFRTMELLEHINLAGNKLTDASMAVLAGREIRSLKTLDLSENNIKVLKKGTFVDMKNVEDIKLTGNKLESIDPGAFSKLPKLKSLDLAKNLLQEIHADVVDECPKLERLLASANNISHVSELKFFTRTMPKLAVLDLEDNSLNARAPQTWSGHPNLQVLKLSANDITQLEKKTFSDLPNLRELYVSHNRIQTTPNLWNLPKLLLLDISHNDLGNVSAQFLAGLPKLTSLDLAFNMVTSIEKGAFLEVASLKSLNMSFNKITDFPQEVFIGLRDLYSLDISYNELTEVKDTYLRGLSSLEHLLASHNRISRVDPSAFTDTSLLKYLDLSTNILQALPAAALKRLGSLRTLIVRRNALNAIHDGDFSNLKIVETLDLSKNHIQAISELSFASLAVVRDLDISSNYIQNLPHDLLAPLKLLERLNISHNFLATLEQGSFSNNKRLRILDLTNNSLTLVDETLTGLSSLQGLFLSHNYIDKLAKGTFQNLPALNVLYFDNNGLQQFEPGTFDDLRSLVLLDLSSNNLVELNQGSFGSLISLKELRLDNNQITMVKDGAFKDLPSLQSLELQDNLISFIGHSSVNGMASLRFLNLSKNAIQDIPTEMFERLSALDVLDISSNFILEIDDHSFANLEWLTVLMLHNNDICRLSEGSFVRQRRLRVLTLNGNQLRRLHLQALGSAITGLSLLDMSDNPFSCDCQLTWLREYMQGEEERLVLESREGGARLDPASSRSEVSNARLGSASSRSEVSDARLGPASSHSEVSDARLGPASSHSEVSDARLGPASSHSEVNAARLGSASSHPEGGDTRLGPAFEAALLDRSPLTKLQLLALQRFGLSGAHWAKMARAEATRSRMTLEARDALRSRETRAYASERVLAQLPLTAVPTCAGPPQYAGLPITQGESYLDLTHPILLTHLSPSVTPPPAAPLTTTYIIMSSTPSHLDLQVTQQVTQKLASTLPNPDYNLITGDTPTIYAGNPSPDPDPPQESSSLFPGLPSLPSILQTIGSISNLKLPNIGLSMNWAKLPVGRIASPDPLSSKFGVAASGVERKNSNSKPPLWIEGPNGTILNPMFDLQQPLVPSLENPKKIYPNDLNVSHSSNSALDSFASPSISFHTAEEGRSSQSIIKFPEDRSRNSGFLKGPNPDNFRFPDDPPRSDGRAQSGFSFPSNGGFPHRQANDRRKATPPSLTRQHPLPSVVNVGPGMNAGRPFLPGLAGNQPNMRSRPSHIIKSRPGLASVTRVVEEDTRTQGQTRSQPQWSTPEVINPLSGVSLYQPLDQFMPYQPPRTDNPIREIPPPFNHGPHIPGLVPPKIANVTRNSNRLHEQHENSEILTYLDPTNLMENNPLEVVPFVPEFEGKLSSDTSEVSTESSTTVVSTTVFFPDHDQALRLRSTPSLDVPGFAASTVSSQLVDSIPQKPLKILQINDSYKNVSASSFPVGISDDKPHSIDDILDVLYGLEDGDALDRPHTPVPFPHNDSLRLPHNLTNEELPLGLGPPPSIRIATEPTHEQSSFSSPTLPNPAYPSGLSHPIFEPVDSTKSPLPLDQLPPRRENSHIDTTEYSVASTTFSQRPPTVYGTFRNEPTPVPISESLGDQDDFVEPQLGLGVSVMHGKPSPEKKHQLHLQAADAAAQIPENDHLVQISPDLGPVNILGEGPDLDTSSPVTRYAFGITNEDPKKIIRTYGLDADRIRDHSLYPIDDIALLKALRYGSGPLNSAGGLIPPPASENPPVAQTTTPYQDSFYDYQETLEEPIASFQPSGDPFSNSDFSSTRSREPQDFVDYREDYDVPEAPQSHVFSSSVDKVSPPPRYSGGGPDTIFREDFVPSLSPSMAVPPPQGLDKIGDPHIALRQQHPLSEHEEPKAGPLQEDVVRQGTLEKDSKEGPLRDNVDWYYENYFRDYSNSTNVPIGRNAVGSGSVTTTSSASIGFILAFLTAIFI
ncbi:uncharacterized protein LOC108681673 [Hyalella azteca]|uniref:Uncharacterized protein LOC108681673 n=1 Tax=Hyalella azteca TaxID=294128 RepID=A0A8B7PJ67_HYAAZ|nr:uncharacterized protein LOC108681673 [Hyalella azteca]